MKFLLYSVLVLFTAMNVNSQTITSGAQPSVLNSFIKATGTGYGGIVTNVKMIQYTSTSVYILSSGVGSYVTGPWVSPNKPSDRNFSVQFPFNPTVKTGTKLKATAGLVGLFTNGVPIYTFGDGMTWNSQGIWTRTAYFWELVSFDSCYGHADGQGNYHHHVNPICLYDYTTPTKHSPIVGYVIDGYPIYGPFGFSDPTSSTSGIKHMVPSHVARSITQRSTMVNGTILASNLWGPDVNTAYPIGAFAEDYIYTAGAGDLDECGGRWCVTPEYPNGTYAYFISTDNNNKPLYPFTFLCYYGNPINPGVAAAKATVPTNATVYFNYYATATSSLSVVHQMNSLNILAGIIMISIFKLIA